MANFSLGLKSQIINSDTQNIARFFKLKASGNGYEQIGTSEDFTGNAATADTPANLMAQADRLVIDGFVTLDKGKVKNAAGSKGIVGQRPKVALTFTASGITEFSEFNVALKLKSPNFEVEFARWDSNFERTFNYPLIIKVGETAADIVNRLEELILLDTYQERPYFQVVSKSSGVITITTKDPAYEIEPYVTGKSVDEGKVTLTSAVTEIGFEGRNNWDTLKGFRPENEATLMPMNYNIGRDGLPVKGKLYTHFTVEKTVERVELQGSAMANGDVTGTYAYELFIDQSLTQYRLAVTSWINANVAKREFYPATTAALATASPEVVNKFTVVSAAPFTTGLQ